MKIFLPLFCIVLKLCLISGGRNTRYRGGKSPHPFNTIKLLDVERKPSTYLQNTAYPHNYQYHHPGLILPHKKSGRLSSMIKGMVGRGDNSPEDDEPEVGVEIVESPGHGWGWQKPKKHKPKKYSYKMKEDGSASFGLLDLLLSALSLISFGAFLINLFASLLSLFGFGFTNTGTVPATFTTTTTGTNTSRNGRKRKKKRGSIRAELGVGSPQEKETGGWTEQTGDDITNDDDVVEDSPKLSSGVLQRPKREIWEPSLHPYTSLNIATRDILNSIESINSNYECMEKVVYDSNRHAIVVGRGLQFFMPIYTFATSYFGQKLGLHQELKVHLHAIILGVQEANYNSNFPQCSHPQQMGNS